MAARVKGYIALADAQLSEYAASESSSNKTNNLRHYRNLEASFLEPIRRLPSDILEAIFLWNDEMYADTTQRITSGGLAYNVTCVSYRWRCVARGYPRLWSCLHGRNSGRVASLKLAISLSGPHPLEISIRDNEYHNGLIFYNEDDLATLQVLVQEAHRCKTGRIPGSAVLCVQALTHNLELSSMTSLETSWSSLWTVDDTLVVTVPRLKQLILLNSRPSTSFCSTVHIPWESLTSLYGILSPEIWELLPSMAQLVELMFECNQDSALPPSLACPFRLSSSIRTLTLNMQGHVDMDWHQNLFSRLSLPPLTTFTIQQLAQGGEWEPVPWSPHSHSALISMFDRSPLKFSLQSLHFHTFDLSDPSLDVPNLQKLLVSCPSIRVLEITPAYSSAQTTLQMLSGPSAMVAPNLESLILCHSKKVRKEDLGTLAESRRGTLKTITLRYSWPDVREKDLLLENVSGVVVEEYLPS